MEHGAQEDCGGEISRLESKEIIARYSDGLAIVAIPGISPNVYSSVSIPKLIQPVPLVVKEAPRDKSWNGKSIDFETFVSFLLYRLP